MAAILLAAAVVAATQFLHPTFPTASVSPDAPPNGVPLFYFVVPEHHHTLDAYDWSGRRRGSITLPSWVDLSRVRMAPDGSSFVIDPAFDGDWLGYFDRLGNTVVETQTDVSVSQVWADDDRHLCLVADPDVVIRLPGSPDRIVNVQHVYEQPGSVTVDACGMRANVAIFAAVGGPGIAVSRVTLSNGKTLNAGSFPPDLGVVVSVDGSLVAVGGSSAGPAMVYRAADLTQPVAQLPPSATPVAFSGDDASLLVQAGLGLAVVKWSTGEVSWRLDQAPNSAGQPLARPEGADFAFVLAGANGDPNGVLVVRPDGTALQLAHGRPITW